MTADMVVTYLGVLGIGIVIGLLAGLTVAFHLDQQIDGATRLPKTPRPVPEPLLTAPISTEPIELATEPIVLGGRHRATTRSWAL